MADAGQARRSAADPLVASVGIVLKDQAVGERSVEVAGVELREEVAVLKRIEVDGAGVTVIDRPADVVMAAQIRDPGRGGGDGGDA